MITTRMTIASTALLVAGLGATTAHAARDANPDERGAMAAAAGYDPASLEVTRISTVNVQWGFATDTGTITLLRRTADGWRQVAPDTVSTSSGYDRWTCSALQRAGVPASVSDDLRIADVRFRCAAPPPLVPCWSTATATFTFVPRPRTCLIAWRVGPIGVQATFRNMKWIRWMRTGAIASADVSIRFQYVAQPIRARVQVLMWRPREASFNGFAFTRSQILGLQAYPIPWQGPDNR